MVIFLKFLCKSVPFIIIQSILIAMDPKHIHVVKGLHFNRIFHIHVFASAFYGMFRVSLSDTIHQH